MAKNKQQKKKEREKRVAQKKIAAAKKRSSEKATKESQQSIPGRSRVMGVAAPKTKPVVTNKKNTFTQRRSGG